MLIRFGTSNHASIAEYQEISLVASALTDSESDLIVIPDSRIKLLPSILIYGPNAAGKTNIIGSLAVMASAIKHSHISSRPNSGVPRNRFAFADKYVDEPTRHDCDFVIDGIRYHYGFTYNNKQFFEEWLYAFPSGSRQNWYYRRPNEPISFGKNLRGRNKSIEDLVRDNSLFLSAAAQNAHPQLTPIYNYFDKYIKFDMSPSATEYGANSALASQGKDRRIIEFLRLADTGIVGVHLERQKRSEKTDKFIRDFEALYKNHFALENVELTRLEDAIEIASLSHATAGKEGHNLSLSDESRGTLRLIELLAPGLQALDNGGALVVDEIDTSLHPILTRSVLRLFASNKTNAKRSQIIATTHDTNLLCSGVVRRDQVWFAEKNRFGSTCIYPLTDLKTRKTDNLEKGYIEGRFGAIPLLGNVSSIFERH